jgi:hypothetical protein
VYDGLILVAPCNSAVAAELKVRALQLAVQEGERYDRKALLIEAADQVLKYLEEPAGLPEAEQDPLYDRMYALENAVMVGPIASKADAMAKLRASAGLTFERGDRLDKGDEPAFWQAVAWLEAN